ncbi:uncharacterized protein BKA55DRAFT_706835 [Fusarium redolens]|uniref:Uncharacterized protein n=1 Tax=Fusarium redolens TaxID=48865 RepID=A0A9P9GKL3_FUSRE|nr:uncharacterized protein BKA55DRAFT_706835 [Fusarium redolens]KAH7240260.1 hypothetical protein BKA55DRAFT_706835 [Fusarium redolens]
MAPTTSNSVAVYNIVGQREQPSYSRQCLIRSDDNGLWNACKAWYLFFIHIGLAVAIMVLVIQIDGRQFKIGSGSTLFTFHSRLYQAQVTGLLSLALVTLRLVAGTGSALLAWRIIFILLEKRGVTLVELKRLLSLRVPIIPAGRAEISLRWSLWATAAIILMWPHGFAAPLASSSLSWIPGITLLDKETPALIGTLGPYTDCPAILYDDTRATAVISAAAMTANEPGYAFKPELIHLRRYFNASKYMPTGSRVNLPLPYFVADVRWVDASSNNRSIYAGNAEYSDVGKPVGIRLVGATSIIMDQNWSPQGKSPANATIFNGTKLVAAQLPGVEPFGGPLAPGSAISERDRCRTTTKQFGKLPAVAQHQVQIINGDKEIVYYDCYMLAEVAVTAGIYPARDSEVVYSDTTSQSYATCSVKRNDEALEGDWLSSLALDFTSETLKYTVLQNFSQPWISPNLDDYVTGMLALGYHATWSALMKRLGNKTGPISFKSPEPVVFVAVDRFKLYIWLGMNTTLKFSAILVFGASMTAKAKTVRDTALAPLTMDLTDIVHSPGARGLCNAASLSRQDNELPRMPWQASALRNRNESEDAEGNKLCSRKVVFADDAPSARTMDVELDSLSGLRY